MDFTFGGGQAPAGYDEGTLARFYNSVAQPIEQDTAGARGRARVNAAAAGLEGTPTETGGVASADYYGGLRKDAALSDLAFKMAELTHSDAATKQSQDFTAGQSEAQRSWQSHEAALDRAYKTDAENTGDRKDMQSALWGMGAQMAGSALGSFGGPIGSKLGGMAAGYLAKKFTSNSAPEGFVGPTR